MRKLYFYKIYHKLLITVFCIIQTVANANSILSATLFFSAGFSLIFTKGLTSLHQLLNTLNHKKLCGYFCTLTDSITSFNVSSFLHIDFYESTEFVLFFGVTTQYFFAFSIITVPWPELWFPLCSLTMQAVVF